LQKVPSTEVVTTWEPTWSPLRALWGYAVEHTIFEKRAYRKYPLYSGYEEYHCPEPIGMILIGSKTALFEHHLLDGS
jgi:hypothetical protein